MNSQCLRLLQKAQRSLDSAKLMADNGFYEFSVSRAYYAMFYVAEAFLLAQDRRFSSHAAVIAAFGQHVAKLGLVPVVFHRYLIDAQDLRIRGDYDVDAGLSQEDAQEQIDLAQEFLSLGWSAFNRFNDEA
ncbi:MAG: HEPN domain-containing protein [Synechococcales bacterium]|nr:HEPN domain-containing protein [Synechococcales bacterium]